MEVAFLIVIFFLILYGFRNFSDYRKIEIALYLFLGFYIFGRFYLVIICLLFVLSYFYFKWGVRYSPIFIGGVIFILLVLTTFLVSYIGYKALGLSFVFLRFIAFILDGGVNNKTHNFINLCNPVMLICGPVQGNLYDAMQNNGGTQRLRDFMMSSVQSILLIYFSYMFLRASLPNLDAFISLSWIHQLLTYWLFGLIFLVGLFLNFYGFIKLVESGRTLLGLATIKNFDKPWMAKSFGEFWRRWHISLGVLIRQILFNPLAIFFGRKYGAKVGIALASFISFLLLGLWHGQSIFFLYFGIIHGGMVAIEGFLSIRLRAVLFFLINPISFCIFSYGFFVGK